ncbi:MAG: transglycosylase family protein [Acidobacteria bacterium]|nr:transglycosylase family protein [Acidobacteriota bacterium]
MSLLLAAVLVAPVGHGPVDYADWLTEWGHRAEPAFNSGLIAEFHDFFDRHPVRPSVGAVSPRGVEGWRALITTHFPAFQVEKAWRVVACESAGDPNAVNQTGGYAGLFQHAPTQWKERSTKAGWAGASIFDPEANIAVAAWLVGRDGWGHWPRCGR